MDSKRFFLGIDLGTTTVKVTLLDPVLKVAVMSHRSSTDACVKSDLERHSEQDVGRIFTALFNTLSKFPKKLMSRVCKIGVCGQMHGCLFWRRSVVLSVSETSLPLSTGFACATIFWFARNDPDLLSCYDCAGTIQDFLVAVLCGLSQPIMSTQNAVSWGFFDLTKKGWEKEMLKGAGFPVGLLPDVCEPETIAGLLKRDFYGIPVGTQIAVAFGDTQCSILFSGELKTDAVLNIGTASQLAVRVPSEVMISNKVLPTVQVWPFFKGETVAVAASLTGGNALSAFVGTLQKWMRELEVFPIPDKQELHTKLSKAASKKANTTLDIRPTLWGERHNPNQMGEVSFLTESNVSLGDVTASICKGIINNLQSLMPKDWLSACGVQRIVGTGTALAQNIVLQKQAEQMWGLPLVMKDESDASFGAALALL